MGQNLTGVGEKGGGVRVAVAKGALKAVKGGLTAIIVMADINSGQYVDESDGNLINAMTTTVAVEAVERNEENVYVHGNDNGTGGNYKRCECKEEHEFTKVNYTADGFWGVHFDADFDHDDDAGVDAGVD